MTAPADFGLAGPITDAQADALVELLHAGAVGEHFAVETPREVHRPSPFLPLCTLKQLGLVGRSNVAAEADPGAWGARASHQLRIFWWLEPQGAALACELQRQRFAAAEPERAAA